MKKIAVFDTSISDYNLGNQIIMESVNHHLDEMFPHEFFFKLPVMEITNHTLTHANRCDFVFFGGTNALTGQMERYRQWDLNIVKAYRMNPVVLMGLGWWQYQAGVSLYTKIILRRVLSGKFFHSVRDSHTKEMLERIGISNVINTGCPTLWSLSPQHCAMIPKGKSKDVVITFTDYNKNPERDKHLLETLKANYHTLFYWIQGEGDLEYIKALGFINDVELIDPNLRSYDSVLNDVEVDYVGTRLHAGIRALQKKRRALIIGIDNRALEMKRDFDLPVLHQNDIAMLDQQVNARAACNVKIPADRIKLWKNQFNADGATS